MPAVLLTGMSGTGKSTVLVELARRGLRVVDTDHGPWCVEVESPDGSGPDQRWREDLLDALLEEHAGGPLVVAGCVSNQGRFYDRFDAVVLLSLPVEILLERIASRTTNSFGKRPAERERILRDMETVEPLLRATATLEVDAMRPLGEVVDAVAALAVAADLAGD